MNPVHKNAGERMQLMISRRIPPPVRKLMTMMMMMKVLSPEYNHSRRITRSDVRPLMKVKT